MNWRRLGVLAGVVSTAVLAGVLATGHLRAGRRTTHIPDGTARAASPAAMAAVHDGPVAAAVAAVEAEANLYRQGGAAAVEADLEQRAATDSGHALVSTFAQAADHVAQAWPGGPTGWWVAPLAARMTSLGADRAAVEIWLAEVVVPPALQPYGDWRTTMMELRREAGEWKIVRSEDGPAPFLRTDPGAEPVSHAGMASFLAGFEGVHHG